MITLKKACLLATVGAMLAPAAFAADGPKDVVRDARGNVVVNTFGNCVITKWDSATDECGMPHRMALSKEQRTVYFDFNKSTLNAKEKAKLDSLAKLITSSKQVESVDIVGFADRIGTDGYNKRLSEKRAKTVKSYLAGKGLKTRKVRLEALGESQPVTDCQGEPTGADRSKLINCLAADRRVEIELNLAK